jgi:hypothetical protein
MLFFINILILLAVSFCLLMCNTENPEFQDILSLLPDKIGSGNWIREDESIQTAAGEELYDLINGGADLYLEYGFQKAAFAVYEGQGKAINVEIYQMDGDSAAYGINSLKKGRRWKSVDRGQEGFLSAYYLNFWKGVYQVSVIGMDSTESSMQGILIIAGRIAAQIQEEGDTPAVFVDQSMLRPRNTIYFRGPIALLNIYAFDSIDSFGSRDGIYHAYDGFELFIFRYHDAAERAQKFIRAVAMLEKSENFRELQRSGKGVCMVDEKGAKWFMVPDGQVILAWRGSADRDHLADVQLILP